MKKKTIAICAIVVVVFVFGVLLLLKPKAICNIDKAYTSATSNSSAVTFQADKGDRIKFSFRSEINAGDLEIIVYSSDGSVIYVLDHAKELETYYTFDNSGTYSLKAEYTDFVGSFEIAIYPANVK